MLYAHIVNRETTHFMQVVSHICYFTLEEKVDTTYEALVMMTKQFKKKILPS